MIIYDENYKFLGISNETVSFLGYEDVTEFISANSDFADLLVEKEGKIYKFQNFSWIDFILYSGAPNKAATVRLKDGTEVDIKLTVKEIVFARELGGINKCYGVRIINDDFVKIASKVNGNMKFEVNRNVKLSNLLTEPSTLIQEDLEVKSKNATSQTEVDAPLFDFPSSQNLKKSEGTTQSIPAVPEIEEEEFHLPFDDFDTAKEEERIVLDFTSQRDETPDTQPKSKSDTEEEYKIDLSFLKQDLDEEVDTSPTKAVTEETDAPQQTQTKVPQEDFISFLSPSEESAPQEMQQAELPIDNTNENPLSFLKVAEIEEIETTHQSENEPHASLQSDFIKISEAPQEPQKEEIIQQIKDDIDEIDREYTLESGNFIRQFLKTEDKESL